MSALPRLFQKDIWNSTAFSWILKNYLSTHAYQKTPSLYNCRGHPSVSMWWEDSWVYTSQMLVKMKPGGFDYVLLCHLQHCLRVWILCILICWWVFWRMGVLILWCDLIFTEDEVPKLGMCFSKCIPGFWLYDQTVVLQNQGPTAWISVGVQQSAKRLWYTALKSAFPCCMSDQTASDEGVIDGVDWGFDFVQASLGQQSPSWLPTETHQNELRGFNSDGYRIRLPKAQSEFQQDRSFIVMLWGRFVQWLSRWATLFDVTIWLAYGLSRSTLWEFHFCFSSKLHTWVLSNLCRGRIYSLPSGFTMTVSLWPSGCWTLIEHVQLTLLAKTATVVNSHCLANTEPVVIKNLNSLPSIGNGTVTW